MRCGSSVKYDIKSVRFRRMIYGQTLSRIIHILVKVTFMVRWKVYFVYKVFLILYSR